MASRPITLSETSLPLLVQLIVIDLVIFRMLIDLSTQLGEYREPDILRAYAEIVMGAVGLHRRATVTNPLFCGSNAEGSLESKDDCNSSRHSLLSI